MEEVYTPTDFFNLPDYLQRKILIEDLDLQSIGNLCDAVSIEKDKNPGAVKFFQDFCENVQFWQDKFQYDFPRSFPSINRDATKTGAAKSIFYWKNSYEAYKKTMPLWEEAFIKDSWNGDLRGVRSLLLRGVDPDIQDEKDQTALMIAVRGNRPRIVEALLEAGADVNVEERHYGNTALIYAAEMGFPETIKLLLDFGADVNHQDNQGNKALVGSEGVEIFKMLLEAGLELDYQNDEGETVLIAASKYGDAETIKLLLTTGFDVNHEDNDGNTALMGAAEFENDEIVEVLLLAGADINHQADDGDTALIRSLYAYDRNEPVDRDLETIFRIIKYKPDPDKRNLDGNTAVDLAEGLGLDSVVDALLYLRRMKKAL